MQPACAASILATSPLQALKQILVPARTLLPARQTNRLL